MEVRPDDADRQEQLERWAANLAEQERIERQPVVNRWRMPRPGRSLTVANVVERLGDRVLGRGLDTSWRAFEPEHDHPDRLIYAPSPWHVLPRALRHLGVTDRDTFVEFGCGMGRVVHQAAMRPFRRVVGVEISPALAEIARTNLAARRDRYRCRNVEIVVCDAAEYRVPDDLTIGYLFHPFKDETLDAVIQGVSDSIDRRLRRVRLIYVYPLGRSQVLATGRFRLLKEQESRLIDTPLSRAEIFESL
jgi:hypothetical protein